jgi:hypothetical protein
MENVFDLVGIDVLPAANDHVLDPVDEVQVPLFVEATDVDRCATIRHEASWPFPRAMPM